MKQVGIRSKYIRLYENSYNCLRTSIVSEIATVNVVGIVDGYGLCLVYIVGYVNL